MQKQLMGRVPHEMTAGHFISLAATTPYYSFFDYVRMLRGIVFSGKALEREIYSANLFKSASEIDVSVYFFEGRHDTVLSSVTAEKYFTQLTAPRGKHLVWSNNRITGRNSRSRRNIARCFCGCAAKRNNA